MANKQNIAGATSGNNVQLPGVVLDTYSQEIIFAAMPNLRFESVATKKTDLSVNPGGRIAFLRYDSLEGRSAIAETATIETRSLNTSFTYISVGEHAQAVAMSELLMREAMTDTLQDASVILGANYAKNRDMVIRDALYTAPTTMFGKGVANRAALTASKTFDVALIQDAVEQLAVNKAPKFNGDAYVCFLHPRQSKYIRRDTAWITVVQYGDPTRAYNGEIGRIEDVRFIETTMIQKIIGGAGPNYNLFTDNLQEFDRDGTTAITTNSGATATNDILRAVIVGENAVGVADALPVEMRDNGVEDFGRKHSIAYYAIFGAGLIESGNAIILETN